MPRTATLDDIKRHEICALLACGASRNEAAEYVGCATTTIANTARRDPNFAERLRQAECHYALRNLRAINRAAGRSWRAAAWALREHNPEVFGHNRVSHFVPASIARAAACDNEACETAAPVGVPASAGASSSGRPPNTRHQPRSSSGRFLPKTATVSTFADPPGTSPSDAPHSEPSSAAGPDADDAFHALEQAVAAAGLSAEQQDQVLARFALLTVPDLAEQFPNLLADLALPHGNASQSGPSLRDGNPTGPSVHTRPRAAIVGQQPPFNAPSQAAVVGRNLPLIAAQSGPSLRDGTPISPSVHNRPRAAVVGRKPPSAMPSPAVARPRKHAAASYYIAAIVAGILLGLVRELALDAPIGPFSLPAGQAHPPICGNVARTISPRFMESVPPYPLRQTSVRPAPAFRRASTRHRRRYIVRRGRRARR